MKHRIAPVLCLALFIGLTSCKDTPAKDTSKPTPVSQTSATASAVQTEQDSELESRYVMVPNGLSLRAANTLGSEKLAVMPFRSQVVLLEEATATPFEVEHIKGGMHKIRYEGKTGYAFGGFLSQLPLPQEEESTEDYITTLKEKFAGVAFESKANDPDFHEGTTDTFTLPAASWHEAFFIVAAMYQLPKTLGFPSPSGPEVETIEDPEKPSEVWDSFVTANRKNNAFEKIEYDYRAEGFGYGFAIVRESEKLFKVEYLGFVD